MSTGSPFLLWIVWLSAVGLSIRAGGAEPIHKPPAAEWPQFRGPDGQGHADARGLPLTWSEKENIAWKVEVPGLGWSSPVIQGQQIWLTTAIEKEPSLRALCLDRAPGRTFAGGEGLRPKAPHQAPLQERPRLARPHPRRRPRLRPLWLHGNGLPI